MRETGASTRWLPIVVATLVLVLVLVAWLSSRPPAPGTGPSADSRGDAPGGSAEEATGREPTPVSTRTVTDPEDEILLTGRVLDRATGDPISGAHVIVHRLERRVETRTGPDGRWRLVGPRSRYWRRTTGTLGFYPASIRAESPGYFARTITPSIPETAMRLDLGALRLERADGRVEGRVVDVEGGGIAGVHVGLRGWRTRGPSRIEGATSGPDGRFGPIPVRFGSYSLRAEGFGWRDSMAAVLVSPSARRAVIEVVVAPAPEITGIVVDDLGRAVPGAEIRASARDEPSVLTDGKGRFRWPCDEGLATAVRLRKDGHLDVPHRYEVHLDEDNRLVLPRARVLEGRILRADGSAAADLEVECAFRWTGEVVGSSDAQGRYRLEGAPLGECRLEIRKHGMRLGVFRLRPGPAEPPTRMDVRLPATSAIVVQVVDAATGKPLAGAMVVGPNSSDWTETDDEGRASLAFEAGCPPHWLGLHARYPGYVHGEFKLRRSPVPDHARIELRRLAPVTVRVVSPEGSPLEGIGVRWQAAWPVRGNLVTGSDGVVSFLLPPGSSRLTLECAGATPRSVPLSVGPAGVTQDVVLGPPEGSTEIRVRDPEGDPVPGATLYDESRGVWEAGDENGVILSRAPDFAFVVVSAPNHEERRVRLRIDERGRSTVVELRPEGVVRGRVVDPEGAPVPGVEVSAGRSTLADGRGRFSIAGLALGAGVLVEASATPLPAPIDGAWAKAGGEEVVLVHPGLGRLRLTRTEGGVDFGKASGGVAFCLDHPGPDGTARMVGVPVRRIGESLLLTAPAGRLSVRIHGNDDEPIWGGEAVVRAGEETTVPVGPPRPRGLTGLVLGPDGEPVSYAELLDAVTGEIVAATRDGKIRVVERAMLRPRSRLFVKAKGFAPHLTEPLDLATHPRIEVRLTRGGTLRVSVLGPDRRPRAARIRILRDVGPHRLEMFLIPEYGQGELDHVAPGPRRVQVISFGLPVHREVRIAEGRTTELTVILDEDG